VYSKAHPFAAQLKRAQISHSAPNNMTVMLYRILVGMALGCCLAMGNEAPTLGDLRIIVGKKCSSPEYVVFKERWPLKWVATSRETSIKSSGGTTTSQRDRFTGGSYLVEIYRERGDTRDGLVLAVVIFPVKTPRYNGIDAWEGDWPAALDVAKLSPKGMRQLYGRADIDEQVATKSWGEQSAPITTRLLYGGVFSGSRYSYFQAWFEFIGDQLDAVRLVR
jgi:hypothetical protein